MLKSLYANDAGYFTNHPGSQPYSTRLVMMLQSWFGGSSVGQEWLQSRHQVIRGYVCVALLGYYYCDSPATVDHETVFTVFDRNSQDSSQHDFIEYYSAIIHLSSGNLTAALTCCQRIQDKTSGYSYALQATFAFLDQQFDLASKLYRKALTALRKQNGFACY